MDFESAASSSDEYAKPGAVSRPGTLPEFQFPECTDLTDRVKRAHRDLRGFAATCYPDDMVKALELAISKVGKLPEAAQEQLGRELLERIESIEQLRAEIQIGIRELDAGLGRELDIEDILRQAHEEHAKKA